MRLAKVDDSTVRTSDTPQSTQTYDAISQFRQIIDMETAPLRERIGSLERIIDDKTSTNNQLQQQNENLRNENQALQRQNAAAVYDAELKQQGLACMTKMLLGWFDTKTELAALLTRRGLPSTVVDMLVENSGLRP